MRHSAWVAVGLAAVLGFGLAGCSGSSGDSGSSSGSVNSLRADAPMPADGRAAVPGVPARGRTTQSTSGSSTTSVALSTAKIRTAQLEIAIVNAADVTRRADEATAVTQRAGGEVDSDDRTGGKDASASMRLRVPPAMLTATLQALSRLGKVTSRQLGVRDVTAQVADVDSRVESAQRAIARLRTLYGNASRVSDVIAVEQQLSSREADLEALQAQQRSLGGQTSLATITLTLQTAPPVRVSHPRHGGIVGGLRGGWNAFVRFVVGIATGIGAALPFLALLAALATAARLVWRRRARVSRPAQAPVQQ